MDEVTKINSREIVRLAYSSLLKGQNDLASKLASEAYEKSLWSNSYTEKPNAEKNSPNLEALAIQIITSLKKNDLNEVNKKLNDLNRLKINQDFTAEQRNFLNKITQLVLQEAINSPITDGVDAVDLIGVQMLNELSTQEQQVKKITSENVSWVNNSLHLSSMAQAMVENITILKREEKRVGMPLLSFLYDDSMTHQYSNKNLLRGLIQELSLPTKLSSQKVSKQYYDNCIKIQLSKVIFEIESLLNFNSKNINLSPNLFSSISHLPQHNDIHNPQEVDYVVSSGPTSLGEDFKELWEKVKTVIDFCIEAKKEYDRAKEAFSDADD